MIAWNVILNRRRIDRVFQKRVPNTTIKEQADDIRRGLINHDGYDPGIVVRKAKE